jgi:CubicO group peptidase (beta-lactamase class C family)
MRAWIAFLLVTCLSAAQAQSPAPLPAAAQASASAPAPVWPGADWQRATPEAMGVDPRALAALVAYGATVQMDSLVVVRHGRLVLEAYYAPFERGMLHRINSATKGVLSAVVGVAIGEGAIAGPQASVADLLPERSPDARWKGVQLQHLLDMTSGLAWTEPLSDEVPTSLIALQRSRDWTQYVLERPLALAPGEAFNYNSGNSHLVSAIVAARTGKPTDVYAGEKLFAPIGIQEHRWRRDPSGLAIGGFGLYLRTPDMARIGHLYLHGGQWNGRQVLPRAWVQRVFDARVEMAPNVPWRYADAWWTLPQRRAYLAVGFNRQLVVVMPDLGLVVAVTGRTHHPIDQLIDHFERVARSPVPLPPDPEGDRLLREQVAAAAAEDASGSSDRLPPLAGQVSGKTYRFPDNAVGLQSLTLRFAGTASYEVQMVRNGREIRLALPIGLDGRFARGHGPEGTIATKGAWVSDDTFHLVERQPEEAATVQYQLRFGHQVVELTHIGAFGARRVTVGRSDD